MDDKGYSFTTQDKLKDYCKKNWINLGLTVYDPTINHDKILEIINYCSLGDYDDSVALVLEVFRFRSNTLMLNIQSQQFLKYFLMTYFISVRKYMESDKSNDLRVFRAEVHLMQFFSMFEGFIRFRVFLLQFMNIWRHSVKDIKKKASYPWRVQDFEKTSVN